MEVPEAGAKLGRYKVICIAKQKANLTSKPSPILFLSRSFAKRFRSLPQRFAALVGSSSLSTATQTQQKPQPMLSLKMRWATFTYLRMHWSLYALSSPTHCTRPPSTKPPSAESASASGPLRCASCLRSTATKHPQPVATTHLIPDPREPAGALPSTPDTWLLPPLPLTPACGAWGGAVSMAGWMTRGTQSARKSPRNSTPAPTRNRKARTDEGTAQGSLLRRVVDRQ